MFMSTENSLPEVPEPLSPKPFVSLNEVARVMDVGALLYCTKFVYKDSVWSPTKKKEIARSASLITSLMHGIDKAMAADAADFAEISFKHFRKTRRTQIKDKPIKFYASIWTHPEEDMEWILVSENPWNPQSEPGASQD